MEHPQTRHKTRHCPLCARMTRHTETSHVVWGWGSLITVCDVCHGQRHLIDVAEAMGR